MRILFIADGRSPIALNWISYFVEQGHEVHLATLFPAQVDLQLASLSFIPVAFSRVAGAPRSSSRGGLLRRLAPAGLRTRLRHWFVPRSLPGAAKKLSAQIARIAPDLVHAMRIPYEGMLAALAVPAEVPLLVSVWGNDFTLHALSSSQMAARTHQTLQRAQALHTDCWRDYALAKEWGFDPSKPARVLPGAGGIQLEVFYPPAEEQVHDHFTVINPRGLRAYVRSDTFFKAVPQILANKPKTRFICPAMQGESEAEAWLSKLALESEVDLLPRLNREGMAEAFRQSQIVLSITTHDGTPNTLLEALACGCFPIAGDIEPLREWIQTGLNGLLVDPTNPDDLAAAVLDAMQKPELRKQAREYNLRLVQERAAYKTVMPEAEAFYQQIISG